MKKSSVWAKNKIEQVKNERDVLAKGAYDQLVRLHYSFQDPIYLYLAMEYCPGGDLYKLVKSFERFEEDQVRLYIAEMILAVDTLHNLGYIHRDLKPDNFLIDARGHLKLADFGLSKEGLKQYAVESPCFNNGNKPNPSNSKRKGIHSVVGSPEYMAPEILKMTAEGYGEEVDWWSIGCLIFDMVAGYPPFTGETPQEVFNNILNWKSTLSETLEVHRQHFDFSEGLMNLLYGFLCESDVRLGKNLKKIQSQPFFQKIDWDNLYQMEPLFVPRLENEYDISYFDCSPPNNFKQSSGNFNCYYNFIQQKELVTSPTFQVQIDKLRRSQTFDKDLQKKIPSWVTPLKFCNEIKGEKTFINNIFSDQIERTRPRMRETTPLKDGSSDKQIIGFTFQRPPCRLRENSEEPAPFHELKTNLTAIFAASENPNYNSDSFETFLESMVEETKSRMLNVSNKFLLEGIINYFESGARELFIRHQNTSPPPARKFNEQVIEEKVNILKKIKEDIEIKSQ